MATTKDTDKKPASGGEKKGARESSVIDPAVQEQVAQLQRQLEDERLQRHALIETNNMLACLLAQRGDSRSAPAAKPAGATAMNLRSSGSTVVASVAPFAARASGARVFVSCKLDQFTAENIVIGVIQGVGSSTGNIDLDTKLGIGGLGWDDNTKKSAFGIARVLVGDEGCLLIGQAADFLALSTIEDVVKFLRNNSVHRSVP